MMFMKVRSLGPGFPIPVEIVPFGYESTMQRIERLPSIKGCRAVLRRGSITNNKADGIDIAVTDNGNFIADLFFNDPLEDAESASVELDGTIGVVEHGIVVNLPEVTVVVASNSGVRIAGSGGKENISRSLSIAQQSIIGNHHRPSKRSIVIFSFISNVLQSCFEL
jgi:ribose 5-phosphate isomerase A